MTASPGSGAPRYVVWELTLRCDLSCAHCGSRAGRPRASELSTGEALETVRQLAAMGAREITLIGGEAYLRDDWDTVARAIVDSGMKCTMTTGGRAFTKERADRAQAAGVAAVSVSIDGLAPAHDRQRGLRGSFDAALGSLRTLREAGIAITANTQLNRLSFADLDALFDLLVAEGVGGWQFQLTVPMGRAAEHPEWLFQPYELLEVHPRLADIAIRGRAQGLLFWPANNIGYYGPHEAIFRNRGALGEAVWTGCAAGKNALGIESDGTIKGCPSLPTSVYSAGNVRQQAIADLWNAAPELGFMRRRQEERDARLWGFCKTCYYASVCGAGCTWTAHVFFGRPGNNPYCHHRALEMKAQGKRERLERVSAAPGAPFDHGTFALYVEDDDAAPRAMGPAPSASPAPIDPKRRRLPIAGSIR